MAVWRQLFFPIKRRRGSAASPVAVPVFGPDGNSTRFSSWSRRIASRTARERLAAANLLVLLQVRATFFLRYGLPWGSSHRVGLAGRQESIKSGFSARGTGMSTAMAPAVLKLRTSTFVFGLAGDVPVVRTSGKIGVYCSGNLDSGLERQPLPGCRRPPIRSRDSHGLAANQLRRALFWIWPARQERQVRLPSGARRQAPGRLLQSGYLQPPLQKVGQSH